MTFGRFYTKRSGTIVGKSKGGYCIAPLLPVRLVSVTQNYWFYTFYAKNQASLTYVKLKIGAMCEICLPIGSDNLP